ncbi:MAG: DinB family protein [Armatimonadetes bacterium]|nr:DinB family protein [Anaerolineae bacterium]
MMALLDRVHTRHIAMMQRTLETLQTLIHTTPIAHLTSVTDGPDGWCALEILCHLRDFDEIFKARVHRILQETAPVFTMYNHVAMVTENEYRAQDPHTVLAALTASRHDFVALFKGLTPEQWERSGTHPENGEWTVTDAAMQVAGHDLLHIEQMTRVLAQAR